MISINCAMMHDKLKEYVGAVEDPKCTLVSEAPMELIFETTDDARAVSVVKAALKATPEFKAVYFQIHAK